MKIQFWNIKGKDSKFQPEEGLAGYKFASIAKECGHEVTVYQDHSFGAAAAINGEMSRAEVLAVSVLSNGVDLLGELALPDRPTIIGGPGATLEPREVMRFWRSPRTQPVALVQGDGEQLSHDILINPPGLWNELEGTWCLQPDGRLKEGAFQFLADFEKTPPIALEGSHQRRALQMEADNAALPAIQRLSYLRALTNSQFETRRGCYFRCGFCSTSSLPLRGVRTISPSKAVREMEQLFYRHGITFFSLTDNVAFDRPAWWREFASLMSRSDAAPYVQFGGYGQPKIFVSQHWLDGPIQELYQAGLRSVIFGVQAGSARILRDVIHRPPDDPENAFKIAERLVPMGINVKLDFIVGHPTENAADLKETLRWIEKLHAAGAEIFVRRLGIVPHSEYARRLAAGEFDRAVEDEETAAIAAQIFQFKAKDEIFRERAFRIGVPNKYLIDRELGIVYPGTLFSRSALEEGQAKLARSRMPQRLKEHYRRMFAYAIEAKG